MQSINQFVHLCKKVYIIVVIPRLNRSFKLMKFTRACLFLNVLMIAVNILQSKQFFVILINHLLSLHNLLFFIKSWNPKVEWYWWFMKLLRAHCGRQTGYCTDNKRKLMSTGMTSSRRLILAKSTTIMIVRGDSECKKWC